MGYTIPQEVLQDILQSYLDELSDQCPPPYILVSEYNAVELFFQWSY